MRCSVLVDLAIPLPLLLIHVRRQWCHRICPKANRSFPDLLNIGTNTCLSPRLPPLYRRSFGLLQRTLGTFMLRYRFRILFDSAVAKIPRPLLTGFFKTFTTRPEVAESAGFHVHPCRFDSPLPIMAEIDWKSLSRPRSLPGIDFRVKSALELVAKLRSFSGELDAIPYEQTQ